MVIAKRTIGIRELKAHASEIVHQVANDSAEFVITLRGRPVARIEPVAPADDTSQLDGMGNTRGMWSDMPRVEWEDFLELKKLWEPRPFDE